MDLNNMLNPDIGGNNTGGGGRGNNPGIPPVQSDSSQTQDDIGPAVMVPTESEQCADFFRNRVETFKANGVNHRSLWELQIYKTNPYYGLLKAFAEDNQERFPRFAAAMAKDGSKAVIYPGDYSIIEAIRVYRRF